MSDGSKEDLLPSRLIPSTPVTTPAWRTTCESPTCMVAFTRLTLGHTWDPDLAVRAQGFVHCHRLIPPVTHSRLTQRLSVAWPSVRSCSRPIYSERALPRRHRTFVRISHPPQPGASVQHPFPYPAPNCNGSPNSGHICSRCIAR